MSQWDELIRVINERIRQQVKPQLRWGTVQKVDWPNRRADVKSVADGLMYYDVHLGLGSMNQKPKQGSTCLIAMIEGKETAWYMLSATELDGLYVAAQNETLREVLTDLIDEVKKIIVVHGTTPNVPVLEQIKQRLNKVLIP